MEVSAFEIGVSYRLRASDAEYLAMKMHELLREMGTSELDTIYFSEVVGSVGNASVALYLSRSNVGVLVVASACDDEGKCLIGPVREIASVSRKILKRLGGLIELLKVDYVVKAKLTLVPAQRNLVKYLKMGGVEISDGGSYDAGWYTVKMYKGKYIVSMKKLDVVITLVQEKTGGLASAQLTVSRSQQGVSEPAEEEFVDCLKAASQIIAYLLAKEDRVTYS
ncbi:MAG: hypothetical protein QXE75_02565 [Sulfolobales archaeon]